ncbi:hypothetical protein SCP_0410290 [Sparassis crispa]|uniref:Uncharacterized protein n=1 Tax=Sparassis crispa TaxID=139825 RepID=A0A401GKH8_9APHY|nr:hypothetical protein SCP_0410290 [Sparassis crispa]GBE82644.1 hypothetical protein SCP_0410290 [Sparassis crispa]
MHPNGTQLKKRGRPKGSKNKPGAKNVGRPRKDSQAPRQRSTPGTSTARQMSAEPQDDTQSLLQRKQLEMSTTSQTTGSLPLDDAVCNTRKTATPSSTVPATQHRASGLTSEDEQSQQMTHDIVSLEEDTSSPCMGISNAPVENALMRTEPPPRTGLPMQTELPMLTESPSVQVAGALVQLSDTRWGRASENRPGVQLPPYDMSDIVNNPHGSDLSAGQFESSGINDMEQTEGDEMDEEFHPIGDDDNGIESGEPLDGEGRQRAQLRSSMPLWLANEYNIVREKLTKEIDKTALSRTISGRPDCYMQRSFYETVSNPYLLASSSFQIDPAVFYQPVFFIWLPHCLLGDRIPCPACHKAGRLSRDGKTVFLQKHGWVDKPRRVVDIDHCEYIIGYCYQCGNQPHCGRTYRSWSPAILDILPKALAVQFTFRLTFHSGLTDRLVSLLCDSFRSGMGAETFTKTIQSLHYRRYDQLHLQYLEMIKDRKDGNLGMFFTKCTPFSAFGDRNGYAGFVPKADYFRQFYDTLIEFWAPEMQQCIAMLSARVLSVDHSFKVTKRMARINGTSVFSALHSTVNEYGEIRAMTLTPTKAHDQIMPILATIPKSLVQFGHTLTVCIYTDNVHADKRELEQAFPSLLEGLTPVPEYSKLKPLTIPDHWSIVHLSTAHQINVRLNTIMNHRTTTSSVTAALDMEWPVDLSTGIRGPVAIIQIAYHDCIYLIKTLPFLQNGQLQLPHSLLTFLCSPAYKKVGVNISADFKKLQADCGFIAKDAEFSGQIELGTMAVERNAAKRKNTSLVDLSASILRCALIKDPMIRVSTHWSDSELSQEFVNYAALDVFATWEIFHHLNGMAISQPVTAESLGGTAVTLHSTDGTLVASGIVALDHRPTNLHGVTVTNSRVIVTISNIHVPGYLHPAYLCPSHKATAISTMGTPPFSIVAYAKHLCTSPLEQHILEHPWGETHPEGQVLGSDLPGASQQSGSHFISSEHVFSVQEMTAYVPEPVLETGLLTDPEEENSSDTGSQTVAESLRDPKAEATLCELLLQFEDLDSPNREAIRSRVLGDIWHLHDQFPISQHHGLRRPFARALSAAMFIPDLKDKAAVEAVLRDLGISYNSKVLLQPQWVLQRMRRYVPPPEILLHRVTAVIKTYGPLKDSMTGQPLFNEKAWEVVKNVLENIHLGYYSDPLNVQLYYKVGIDKRGLVLYRCCHGTNDVEGGVHQNLIRRFSSFNISPRHAVNSLLNYAVSHNMQVGTLNRSGQEYLGHFDVPLKN